MAYEAVVAKEALVAWEEDNAKLEYEAVVANEALVACEAVSAKIACEELTAKEAVPKSDPVKDCATTLVATFIEFKLASEPDTITFFQLGIYICLLWLVTTNVCCPLPLRAYNIVINIG